MRKPCYYKPDKYPNYYKRNSYQEVLIYLADCSMYFRAEGYEIKEKPGKYKKDDGKQYQ